MKMSFVLTACTAVSLIVTRLPAQSKRMDTAQVKDSRASGHGQIAKNLYIDVHHLGAGKVTAAAVAGAHAKDLATEKKYGVHFIRYWVNEKDGDVYCLSSAPDSQSIRDTHAAAHGLLPDQTWLVTGGQDGKFNGEKDFFLDVHELGAGNVTAKDVAAAHQKDLATQQKYGVNFVNYWVDEKNGRVVCLSQAPDSSSVIATHKEAHGLIPAYIVKVSQGQ